MKKIFLIILTFYFFAPSIINAASSDEDNMVKNFMIQNPETEEGMRYFKLKEYNKALDFFINKAEEGNMNAAVNAGIIYEHIKKKDLLALKYYKMAAEKGNIIGEYNYGVILYILDDKVKSYKWLLCAAEHKYPLAVVSVQHMKEDKLVSDDEIKKAKILSKNCM